MHCAICGHAILLATEPVLSTTMGELVHIACADCEAQSAYRWRTCRVAISAALVVAVLALAIRAEGSNVGSLALLLLLAVGHVLLNWRWWHLTIAPYWRRWR